MKNRTLAIFGILTYGFSVYASAKTNGVPSEPQFVVITSFILNVLFTVLAALRFWKFKRVFAVLFSMINLIEFASEIINEINSPQYGSTLVLIINIIKIVSFIFFISAIILLWKNNN